MLVRVTKEAYYQGRKHVGEIMDFPAKTAKELPSWAVPHDESHAGFSTGKQVVEDEPDTLHGLEKKHQASKPKPVFDDSAKAQEPAPPVSDPKQSDDPADSPENQADDAALQPSNAAPPVPKAKQHQQGGNKNAQANAKK